jgi:hypothetical protein
MGGNERPQDFDGKTRKKDCNVRKVLSTLNPGWKYRSAE